MKRNYDRSQDEIQVLNLGGYKNSEHTLSLISTLFGRQEMFSVGGWVVKISQTCISLDPELG